MTKRWPTKWWIWCGAISWRTEPGGGGARKMRPPRWIRRAAETHLDVIANKHLILTFGAPGLLVFAGCPGVYDIGSNDSSDDGSMASSGVDDGDGDGDGATGPLPGTDTAPGTSGFDDGASTAVAEEGPEDATAGSEESGGESTTGEPPNACDPTNDEFMYWGGSVALEELGDFEDAAVTGLCTVGPVSFSLEPPFHINYGLTCTLAGVVDDADLAPTEMTATFAMYVHAYEEQYAPPSNVRLTYAAHWWGFGYDQWLTIRDADQGTLLYAVANASTPNPEDSGVAPALGQVILGDFFDPLVITDDVAECIVEDKCASETRSVTFGLIEQDFGQFAVLEQQQYATIGGLADTEGMYEAFLNVARVYNSPRGCDDAPPATYSFGIWLDYVRFPG
jgi:hypothetical protein